MGAQIKSVILVGQKSVIYHIQVVVAGILSVVLVESVILVTVILVVNCIMQNLFSSRAFFWASIQEILRKHLRGFSSFCIFKLSFDVFKLSFNGKNE